MKGWILYKRCREELTELDHGVNRFLAVASTMKVELEVYKPSQFELISSTKIHQQVLLEGKPAPLPDFIIPRMGAETSTFAFALLRQLELNGVYTANRASSIETVKDKMRASQLLMSHHLPSPKTLLLQFPINLKLVEQEIGFPLVVKNIAGARGIGIYLCETANSFRDLTGFFDSQFNQQLIAQQFIADSYGRDLRVFVLGDQVIGCMQRKSKDSFKANYSLGGEVSLFPLNDEIEQLARACTKIMNLEIAGIDLLFSKEGFLICEANSSPGFKGMELATGEDIATKILEYITKKSHPASIVNRP